MRSLVLFLFGLGFATLAGAGCGRVAKSSPAVGGESHFLHWCSGSCEEEGLECISGLCTKPCVVAEPNACSAFSGSSCTDRSIEPGAVAVCDVSCARNDDCAPLGSDYSCDGSFCRAPELPRVGSSGTAASGCNECLEGTLLTWRWNGGFLVGGPMSYITNCNSYTHSIEPTGTVDSRGPACTAALDACGPSSELAATSPHVVLRALLSTLQNSEIHAARRAHTVFGRDGRVVDGQVREITFDSESFFVGEPCLGGDASCVAIPPVVDTLVGQLQALDALELSQGLCASVFPDGWKF